MVFVKKNNLPIKMTLSYPKSIFPQKITCIVGIMMIIYFIKIKFTMPTSTEKVLSSTAESSSIPNLTCYPLKDSSLPDLTATKPKKGRSVFYIDASCSSHQKGKIVISPRHACSVESAARWNPNMDVYLLYTSPGIIKNHGTTSDMMLKTLLEYPNIKMHRLNYEKFIKGTLAENLTSEFMNSLNNPVQHADDLLTFLLLWKYGGLHLSSEMLVLKSMEDLALNYFSFSAGFEPSTSVFNLSPIGDGHEFAQMYLEKLVATLKENKGTGISQDILIRLLQKMCNVSKPDETLKLTECKGITLYKSSTFYPIPWWYLFEPYDDIYNNEISKLVSSSYTMQLSGLLTQSVLLNEIPNSSIALLAEKHCPKIFLQVDDMF